MRPQVFLLTLLTCLAIGSTVAVFYPDVAPHLEAVGRGFLNLLFTVVSPLIFFSISSALLRAKGEAKVAQIMGLMILVFVATGILSSCFMLAITTPLDWTQRMAPLLAGSPVAKDVTDALVFLEVLQQTLTVGNFFELGGRAHIPALLIFACLVGGCVNPRVHPQFQKFLSEGAQVFLTVVQKVMYLAPVGLGAYFGSFVAKSGAQLFSVFGEIFLIYTLAATLYFIGGSSLYAWIGGGSQGIKRFWTNIWPLAITSFATGSSLVSIPVNLQVSRRIGVSETTRGVVIPFGASIHMDGSCLSSILKIVALCALFGTPVDSFSTMGLAILVSLVAAVLMSGIAGGGYIGEMLIISIYGFPPEALPVAALIGTIVDLPATAINACGDTTAAMMIDRFLGKVSEERLASGRPQSIVP